MMRRIANDCRYALRLYLRTPGASILAVAVLAVGLAFVTSFVSLYVDLVLRPHPGFEDSGRIVSYGVTSNFGSGSVSLNFVDLIAEESVSLEAVAATTSTDFPVSRDGTVVAGELVSEEFFGDLKPKLVLGRGFSAAEHTEDGEPVVVISHRYWQQYLGGSPDVLGTTIEVQGRDEVWQEFQIIGVMSADYGDGPRLAEEGSSLWMPIEAGIPLMMASSSDPFSRALGNYAEMLPLKGLARLAPGASAGAAARELNERFENELLAAGADATTRFDVIKGFVTNFSLQRNTQKQLQIFLGASVLLALVAAANVSLFLLSRAPGRRRELGIRMSVGAPVKRLARQLATEASLLVLVAGAAGLALSIWLARVFRGLEFLRRAEWSQVTVLDWRVLTIVGVFLLLLTVLVSLAPILGLKKLGIAATSRQVSSRAGLAQRIAGTTQIAIAGTLAGAAIAFAWYLGSLVFGYPGFQTRDLHIMRYTLDANAYYALGEDSFDSFYVDQSRRREALASLPGVSAVSLTSAVPGMRGGTYTAYFVSPDNPTEQLSIPMVIIDGEYVDVLGLRLLHGRAPLANEPASVLVNESLARSMWGRIDVVGEPLPVFGPAGQVVGVVSDVPYDHPAEAPQPRAFATVTQQLFPRGIAIVESAQSQAQLREQVGGLIESGALELDELEFSTLEQLRWDIIAADRARGLLTIATTAIVVLLSAFGFYATQRYLVTAGRREYAVRASLGAGPQSLGRLVFRRGIRLGLPGLVLGAMLAFVVAAWLRDDYVSRDISPTAVTIGVIAGLVAVLLLASLGPARQVRRTQPAPLLKEE